MKRLLVIMLLFSLVGIGHAGTASDEITAVRSLLFQTESANSIYSDTQILNALNAAQDLLSNLLTYSANHENVAYVTATSTTTSEASFATATISVDLKKIIAAAVTYPSGTMTPMIQVKPEEMPYRYSKGTTKDPVYFVGGGNFYFYPANPGGTTTFYFTILKPYPTLATTASTVYVQTRYLNALRIAATWYVLQADNQTNRAALLYKQLTDLLSIENQMMMNSNVIEKPPAGGK